MIRFALTVLVFVFAAHALTAGPLGDRLGFEVRADYAADFDGFAKIREHRLEGEHLGLHDDLGVDQWFSASFEAAWQFDDMNGLRATFTWNQFRGGKTFDHDVPHDGAVFGAGTTIDFGPTRWWRAELWYELTPWRSEWGRLTLLAGVTLDDLNVFLEPNKPRISSKQEFHEDFGAQRMPLPALGARFSVMPVDGLRLAFEARGTYVDNLATWYHEGGRIYHSQTNLDVSATIGYRVAEVEFGAALRHRVFRIEDDSKEDGNEFAARGTHVGLYVVVRL
ncbi:MAG: hypothetical protein H6839_10930 [Planctomycetes bacterium]|nr:hypothetical protein [Planctomycetota bacterium]